MWQKVQYASPGANKVSHCFFVALGTALAVSVGMETRRDLLERADEFALSSLAFYKRLPKTPEAQVPGVQFLKSSSSFSANYHAARRGRSTAAFISKLGTVVEEIDESIVWLEYMRNGKIAHAPQLLSEAQELRRIFGTALATARRNREFG